MNKKITLLILFGFSIFLFFGNFLKANAGFQDVYYPGCNTEPFYVVGKQWGLEKISIEKAWEVTVGKREIKVGIMDTGIDITHGDLNLCVDRNLSKSFLDADDYYEGKNYEGKPIPRFDDPFYDTNGHGTHIAGIIAADSNNSYGIVGAAPNITLVSLRVININGQYQCLDIVEAIDYAEEVGIDILNFSAGGRYYKEIEEAIKKFSGLFICSAGNDAQDNDKIEHYPSNLRLPNLISVGATDENDNLWKSKKSSGGSNFGLTKVDLFAPGAEIISTYPIMICDGSYRTADLDYDHDEYHVEEGFHNFSGTSMATPYVTAVAALLLSSDYSYTPETLKSAIMNNVDKLDGLKNYCVSGGRLNAAKVLQQVSHKHKFSYKYLNEKDHIKKCTCNISSGSAKAHYVTKQIYDRNPNNIVCMGCLTKLDLSKDHVSIVLNSIQPIRKTEKGSFILPSGVVVLVEEEIDAYLLGKLQFYDKSAI